MSITTYSKFYYGIEITEDNCKMDFDEGGGELTATLDYGTYTPEEIATEVALQLNAIGAFTYTCTFNRSTRQLTITSSSSVEMLFDTGSNNVESAYITLGFDTPTATSTTFTAPSVCCSSYVSQFILQSYVPVDNFIEQESATVNETVTGRQELITYGDTHMTRFNIMFITDIAQPDDGPILDNPSGVSDVLSFLQWITKKNKIEFMEDANTASSYINLVLDSSTVSKNGTTMRLKELYDKGLSGYYETELLTFRKVD